LTDPARTEPSRTAPARRTWSLATVGLAAAVVITFVITAAHGPSDPTQSATGGPPPMGWSSWSFLRAHPTAAAIEAQARALESSGLAAAGYRYVNLDDFWMACDRNGAEVDSYGRWIPNPAAFPDGIAAVARQVHADGLKFGLYVTPGIPENAARRNTAIEGTSRTAVQIVNTSVTETNYDCGHMYGIDYAVPGAQQYVNSWADEFASWGVDYVKLDGVGTWDVPDIQAWSAALRQTGRPMILELSSNLALSGAAQWSSLADGWRTGTDIECYTCEKAGSSYPLTDWANVASRFDAVAAWQPYGGPKGWNDEDSLEIGNGAADGLTVPERQTMMALWSLAGAPLILGADLTHLDPADLALLDNRAVIAVDQDGIAAFRIVDRAGEQVFAKQQPGGLIYAGVFNTDTSAPRTFQVPLSLFGLTGRATIADLWTGSRQVVSGTYTVTIPPGGVSLISVAPPR
jgi:alpha-galactosidase